jgi:hypothetical protein
MATYHLPALPRHAQWCLIVFKYLRFWAHEAREQQCDYEESIQEMLPHREIVGDNLVVTIYKFEEAIRQGDELEWARDWAASEWWLAVLRSCTRYQTVLSL